MYGHGKKQYEEDIIKSKINFFRLKKENEAIKDRIIRDIRTIVKKEDDYYKPIQIGNFWNNIHIRYERSDKRNKNLPVNKYLDEIKLYLRDIRINFRKYYTWKIHLIIEINFISYKDVDEEHEIFESLLSRYQTSVQHLYCKYDKVSFKRGGSCIGSPDLIKKKKSNNK